MPDHFDYPFDSSKLFRNRRQIKQELSPRSSRSLRIHILSGSTIGELSEFLELFLLNFGIKASITTGQFNAFYDEALYGSDVQSLKPDWVYVHTTIKNVREFPLPSQEERETEKLAQEEAGRLIDVAKALTSNGAKVILNNFENPPFREMGNLSSLSPAGTVSFVRRLNRILGDNAKDFPGVFLNDINYVSSIAGLDKWYDWAYWSAFRYAVAPSCLPWLASSVSSLIAAGEGCTKKALVSDLDNTLWGGMIGDDGAEQIALGPDDAKGEMFSTVQTYLRGLAERGIALAINSKNDQSLAMAGLTSKHSQLPPESISAFCINWTPKSQNMETIAQRLNLNPDSFVFLDDNPAELEEVQRIFPEISCVSYNTSPIEMITKIDRLGYFETVSLSQEDISRIGYYKANLERETFKQTAGTIEDYLSSLQMKSRVSPLAGNILTRAVQLINKTNQFNPTTQRTDQKTLEARLEQGSTIALSADLRDRFGDNGVVSVLLAGISGSTAVIDTWVMSCRVFNRTLEHAIFNVFRSICEDHHIDRIEAAYVPTPKNKYVEELYDKLGFTLKGCEGSRKHYELPLAGALKSLDTFIEVSHD